MKKMTYYLSSPLGSLIVRILFQPLEEYMALYEWRAGGNQVKITKAIYGDLAGAVGAACFAIDQQ